MSTIELECINKWVLMSDICEKVRLSELMTRKVTRNGTFLLNLLHFLSIEGLAGKFVLIVPFFSRKFELKVKSNFKHLRFHIKSFIMHVFFSHKSRFDEWFFPFLQSCRFDRWMCWIQNIIHRICTWIWAKKTVPIVTTFLSNSFEWKQCFLCIHRSILECNGKCSVVHW